MCGCKLKENKDGWLICCLLASAVQRVSPRPLVPLDSSGYHAVDS